MTPRVLLADDSPVGRFWMRAALRRLAVDCFDADSGVSLEGRLRDDGPFDLVVAKAALSGGAAERLLSLVECPVILVHEIRGHHAMLALDVAQAAERIVVSEKAFAELVEERLQRTDHVPASATVPASVAAGSTRGPSSRRLG